MTDYSEGDAVEWEAGETVYCGQVREVRDDRPPAQFLVQVFDRDAEEFRESTVLKTADALGSPGDLADDCTCEMGDCTADDDTDTTSDDDSDADDAETDEDGDDESDAKGDVPAETDDEADEAEDGTCNATTADGSSCENEAGDDGYCHIPAHGPDDEDE